MNYSKRDVAIGFIIIILVVVGAFYYKKVKTNKLNLIQTPAPVSIVFQEDIENSFKFDIPDDTNTFELKDVSGGLPAGEAGNGRGIATDKEILADIEDPSDNYFYQGWLQKNDELISLGKLQIAKGGWLLEYDKSKLSDAEKIIISLERVFDNKIEKKILEGSFN